MKPELGGFWTLLLDRFKVTILLIGFILIAGLSAYFTIPRETEPTVEIPIAMINTVWPGATPGDVEKLITNKIEKEIKALENVEEYNSFSLAGVSVVSVEFTLESNRLENMQKLREKIDNVEADLPDTIIDDPEINEVSISDVPVISLTVSGDFSWSELKQFSETIEDELESVQNAKEVNVKGAPEDEFHILVDPIKLEAKKIGINEVIAAIRNSHRDMPLGEVSVDGQKVEVTLRGEFEEAKEFLDVPVRVESNGAVIRLGDFATVRREFKEFDVETFLSTGNPPAPAVAIEVIKSAANGNVIKMATEVIARVESLRVNNQIPRSLKVDVTYNRADEIRKDLDTLLTSGWQTLLLIALVMFLALGWREAILASISIPLSMLIAVFFLHTSGETFNGVSLFALVLAVGLLVDNSIIVVEGLSAGIHEKKMNPHDSAIDTINTYRWPILTGTLTTIFAFLPMIFFISGISGQYVSVLPITVMIVLTAAFFVAVMLLPSVGAKFFAFIPPKVHREGKLLTRVLAWYQKKMKVVLRNGKNTLGILTLAVIAFIASFSLVATNRVPVEVFPDVDIPFFSLKLELPEGSQLTETRQFVEPVAEVLRQYFTPREDGGVWLENFVITVGRESDQTQQELTSGQDSKNIMGITINLTEDDERSERSYEIIPILHAAVKDVLPPYVELTSQEMAAGPPSGAPIEIRLTGDDFSHLEEMADELQGALSQMKGTTNIRDSRADRTTQLTWKFDRDLLASFGLNPVQIAESLRASVNGALVVQITEGDDEIDVSLRVDWVGDQVWRDPKSLDYLERIPVKTGTGKFVTLPQVAAAAISSELSQIDHMDGQRIIKVKSDLEQGVVASQKLPEVEAAIKALNKHPGEVIEIGGENEDSVRLMVEMGQAMMFALLLILVVLVWQFNSFSQALIILAMIPLSLTGVFVGFWFAGLSLSFPSMIGIVSLAGIIVNDAIVLIDRINQNLATGMDRTQAYIESGKERFQPIFLTSLTTVVGMLPLSLSNEMWGGLGFAIVFGMVLSTVLCLLLIPCFLDVEYRSGHAMERWAKKCWCKARGKN